MWVLEGVVDLAWVSKELVDFELQLVELPLGLVEVMRYHEVAAE